MLFRKILSSVPFFSTVTVALVPLSSMLLIVAPLTVTVMACSGSSAAARSALPSNRSSMAIFFTSAVTGLPAASVTTVYVQPAPISRKPL